MILWSDAETRLPKDHRCQHRRVLTCLSTNMYQIHQHGEYPRMDLLIHTLTMVDESASKRPESLEEFASQSEGGSGITHEMEIRSSCVRAPTKASRRGRRMSRHPCTVTRLSRIRNRWTRTFSEIKHPATTDHGVAMWKQGRSRISSLIYYGARRRGRIWQGESRYVWLITPRASTI